MSSNLPQWSLPFAFYHIKYILLEKFSEIFSRHAYVNVIVYLYGNTDSVALSDTEATGKYDLILNVMILHGFFNVEETAIGATIVKTEYERMLREEERDIIITS